MSQAPCRGEAAGAGVCKGRCVQRGALQGQGWGPVWKEGTRVWPLSPWSTGGALTSTCWATGKAPTLPAASPTRGGCSFQYRSQCSWGGPLD